MLRLPAFGQPAAEPLLSRKEAPGKPIVTKELDGGTSPGISPCLTGRASGMLGQVPGPAGPALPSTKGLPRVPLCIVSDEGDRGHGAPTHEATLTGRLRTPASEHDCEIRDLSTDGMKVISPSAIAVIGEQVVIETQDFPAFPGIVSWTEGGEFGVEFATPVSADVINGVVKLTRRVRTARANRFGLELPSTVYFDHTRHDVMVCNISVGGLMMTTQGPIRRGQRKIMHRGQALMIEFPELLPVGGHIRWTCGAKCGIMFSKLLTLQMAEDIVRMANVPAAFLEDVRLASRP